MRNENLWVENVVCMLDQALWHSVRSHTHEYHLRWRDQQTARGELGAAPPLAKAVPKLQSFRA